MFTKTPVSKAESDFGPYFMLPVMDISVFVLRKIRNKPSKIMV